MAAAKILVSESDRDVRRLLVVLIEQLGHEALVLEPDAWFRRTRISCSSTRIQGLVSSTRDSFAPISPTFQCFA